MDPLFLIVVAIITLPAIYLLLRRGTKNEQQTGRPDSTERRELTGTEQHKRREPR